MGRGIALSDSEGEVLDMLMQSRRATSAALRLMHWLLKQYCPPERIVTDGWGANFNLKRPLALSAGVGHDRAAPQSYATIA